MGDLWENARTWFGRFGLVLALALALVAVAVWRLVSGGRDGERAATPPPPATTESPPTTEAPTTPAPTEAPAKGSAPKWLVPVIGVAVVFGALGALAHSAPGVAPGVAPGTARAAGSLLGAAASSGTSASGQAVAPRELPRMTDAVERELSGFPVSLRRVLNRGGGDCLFHAFRQALADIGEDHHTVRSLRAAVAETLTQAHFERLHALLAGAMLNNDRETMQAYGWVLGTRSLEDMKSKVRDDDIWARHGDRYWGDDIALDALEQHTALRPIVLEPRGGAMRVVARVGAAGRKWVNLKGYIFLQLQDAHYELVEIGGRLVHRENRGLLVEQRRRDEPLAIKDA